MKTLWTFNELAPYVFEPMQLSGELDIKEALIEKSPLIEDVINVTFNGVIFRDGEEEIYILSGEVESQLILKSTRSLQPVEKVVTASITESYLAPENTDVMETLDDDDLVFIAEDHTIDVGASVVENIILAIPNRILTEEEKSSNTMPEGEDWKVISEEDFAEEQKKSRIDNSPFNALYSIFDDEDDEQANK